LSKPRYISEEEKASAAYQVFHTAFEVIIPQYATVAPEEEKAWGTTYYRNKSLEAAIASRSVHTVRTIAKLATLHSQGVPITLVNPVRDAANIYKLIQRHQSDMARHISTEVDFVDPESEMGVRICRLVEDLEVLESFARAIYPKAVALLPYANPNISMQSKINRFKMSRVANPSNPEVKLNASAPTSLSDLLSSKQVSLIRSWSSVDASDR
jgi:hypothetical protein